ncbi:MAG: DUF3604 domain-containing protein [Armatimonadota bacterium]|nr:DUF3604 domain-containing protein [Armatimonadota bacterium]
MEHLTVLADMAGRHTAHDVYDLWAESREGSVLFGWQTASGGQRAFCLDGNEEVHPVAVPWDAAEACRRWSAATSRAASVQACHVIEKSDDPATPRVQVQFGEEVEEFAEKGASLLFPTVCFDAQGRPWVAMVRTVDVENDDGVIDQHNYVLAACRNNGGWHCQEVADLAYGLLPRAGVWGYPGRRRRPFILPDDRGGVWVVWERKEPHDASTLLCSGALLGRRFVDGRCSQPVRIVEGGYMDYAPDRSGVRDGRLVVAAQRGTPITEPGRGEVVLLSADMGDRPDQPQDTEWEGWQDVDLAARQYFHPADRELTLAGEQYQLLFGDPHTHTALSEDAEGDLVEMIAYARDRAQIDFVAITDNDYIYGGRLSDAGWRQTMAEGRTWSEDGRFIVIPAYEWTQPKWGPCRPQHRSILFERYDEPMLRWADAGIGGADVDDEFEALLSWIESTTGIMNTQHARFLLSDSDREANMEVICGWGDYINTSECFVEHLNRGFEVGFVGTSDGHRRTPGLGGGLTGLWVRDFTLPGIIEALRSRRCYATAGARIGLRFWVNEAFMGQRAEPSDAFRARIAVQAPRQVELLEVFGDGEVVARLTDLPPSFDEQIDDLPPCGWYFAKVTMPGGFPQYPSNIAPAEGPWAWSSPVFVRPHQEQF